jgi:hypothetical protein
MSEVDDVILQEKLAAQKAEARKKQLQAMEFPLPVKTKPIDNSDAKPSDSVYETSSGSAPNNAPLQSSITIRKAGGYQQEVLEAEWQLCSADIKHVLTEMRAEEIGAYLFSRVNHLSDCFEVPGLKIEPNHGMYLFHVNYFFSIQNFDIRHS